MEMIKAVPAAGARERFAAAAQAHTRSMYRAARTILDSDADAEDAWRRRECKGDSVLPRRL